MWIRPLALSISAVVSSALLAAPSLASASNGDRGMDSRAVASCGALPVETSGVPRPPALTVRISNTNAVSYQVVDGVLYQLVDGGARITRTSGATSTSFIVNATVPELAVDPMGGSYTVRNTDTLVRWRADGTEAWAHRVGAAVTGLFGIERAGEWHLAVQIANQPGSLLFRADGSNAGASGVSGRSGRVIPGGGTVTVDGHYVRYFDDSGEEVGRVGDQGDVGTPMPAGAPLAFQQQGLAVVAPDGLTYVADGNIGIHILDRNGLSVGLVPDVNLGFLTQRSVLQIVGDDLWFTNGGRNKPTKNITSVPWRDLRAAAKADRSSPRLGLGAGVAPDAPLYYAKDGAARSLQLSFDSWWARNAGTFTVRVTTRGWRDTVSDRPVAGSDHVLTEAIVRDGLALPVPTSPGPVDIDIRLLRADGSSASATCVHLSNGTQDQALDFDTLPPGADFGGPQPARAVAYADVLGTGLTRLQVDFRRLAPQGIDGPFNYDAYAVEFAAARAEADRRGVVLEVQVGQGGIEKGLVADGRWESVVHNLVSRYKDEIDVWEAWNEPNITYGSGADYTAKILKPFARAVRSADPTARVVGGTAVGMNLDYYNQLALAGAFDVIDVLGIHPYPGHNRSFEEQGTPAGIAALRALLDRNGRSDVEIWDTESSWWSDGEYNWFAQADNSVRARLWYRALGVERWNYFIPEGGWGNEGVTFSAVEKDNYVKPAALALMTAKSQLGEREFLRHLDTGVPGTYAMQFGPDGAQDSLVAVFSDGLDVDLAVASATEQPVAVVDQYGGSRRTTLGSDGMVLPVSGSVTWLSMPRGDDLRLSALEPFGPNVLVGATATATSSGPKNLPAAAIDGNATANLKGDWVSTPAWGSSPGDDRPALTVKLPLPRLMDRAIVTTHSLGSVVSGLRTWTLSGQEVTNGPWIELGRVDNQFYGRSRLVEFAPRALVALRLEVTQVNYSGYNGGAAASWWPRDATTLNSPTSVWYGPAIVSELAAFAPGEPAYPGLVPTAIPSTPATPAAPAGSTSSPSLRRDGTIVPVEPTRLLDTRAGNGSPQRPLAAGGTLIVKMAGRAPVPATGASAVVLNLTSTGGRGGGFVTAFPNGVMPTVSNLNVGPGETRPNLVTVPLAPDGSIRLYNGTTGPVDLIADVQAWVSDGAVDGDRFHATTPTRLADTRSAQVVPANGTVKVAIRGRVAGSAAATGAYLNLTAVANGRTGFVTAYPSGTDRPLVSNLNLGRETVANLALVPVGADGTVTLYNGSDRPLHLVVDVQGFLTGEGSEGDRLVVTPPVRAYDSRTVRSPLLRAAQRVISLSAANPASVLQPGGRVTAVMGNLTVVAPTGGGFVTSYPTGTAVPSVSNVNAPAGKTVPNAAVVPVGAAHTITAYNGTTGSTDLIVDVQGWFVSD